MNRGRWAQLCVACIALGACGPNSQANEPKRSQTAALEGEGGSSCYKTAGEDFVQPTAQRALFVVVDQSTGLDDHLRETIVKNVKRLVTPGTTYAIYTFSAFSAGHYPTKTLDAEIASPVAVDERPNLSVRRLRTLDRCLEKASNRAVADLETALGEATSESAQNFANSEILASLGQIATAVRESNAEDKLVLLVSDLVEHSTSTSFYKNKKLRAIDPQVELEKAQQHGLVAKFGGANVAVIGAGLLSAESKPGATRDTGSLQSLHDFWARWFEASDAKLTQYGQPDLITPLQWRADGS